MAHDDASLVTSGTWTNVGGFKESTMSTATLALMFMGDEATLTMGTGPDHSIYDIYIGRTLWMSFDGYAATAGERQIGIQLNGEGPHVLEIRNRREKHSQSSGYKLRFKQLVVPDRTFDLHTVKYTYDGLPRLLEANTYKGANLSATPLRQYEYGYDLAGNRLLETLTVGGAAPVTTSYTYNDANQLTSDGTNTLTYDANGNLISDGVNSYTWDQANRLISWDNGTPADKTTYAYDGADTRIQQTVGTDITRYLLDVQPGLALVLSSTTGTDTTRYVHGPRGIHSQQDSADAWDWLLQDGLGSVRAVVDGTLAVQERRMYAPYGEPYDGVGTSQTVYGFTGEPTDANELVYLRARYLNPGLGVFVSLDPWEGLTDRPMSLNGYSWVEGNVANATDPSGNFPYINIMGMLGGLASFALLNSFNGCGFSSPSTSVSQKRFGKRVGQDLCVRPLNPFVYEIDFACLLDLSVNPPNTGTLPSAEDLTQLVWELIRLATVSDEFSVGASVVAQTLVEAQTRNETELRDLITQAINQGNRRIELALGHNLGESEAPILLMFAYNLLNDERVAVPWMFWDIADLSRKSERELTNVTAETFKPVFKRVIRAVPKIHVNLEAIGFWNPGYSISKLEEFIDDLGDEDEPESLFALELQLIRNSPDACSKTIFYDNGSVSAIPLEPQPDICN